MSKNRPFFSVIIPLYNKAKYISNCINSVLAQSFSDFEIIIVNDGSTDYSVSVVETFYSDKIKLFHQDNKGASVARNNAVDYALGGYMAFLDADDLWHENHLESLKESIDLFPHAGLYANNYSIKTTAKFIKKATLNTATELKSPFIVKDFFKASLKDTLVWTSAAAIHKNVFKTFKGFNSLYISSQDLDLWIRIALNMDIVFNSKITMIYDNSIAGSLGKTEDNDARLNLFNSFIKHETENTYLKKYLDQKRFGLALRTKINGEYNIYNATLTTIDFKNLSIKQRLLLKSPKIIIDGLAKIRPFFIKNSIYLRLFKS